MRDRVGSRACGSTESPLFDRSDWAWEYLRPNSDYRADWRETTPRDLPCVLLRDGTSLVRLTRRYPRAEQWGLQAFANPQRSAPHAAVFWLPSHCRSTIKAQCDMTCAVTAPNMLKLAAFHAKRTAAVGVDGMPVVWMKGRGFNIAIIASGWDVLTRPAAITFELAGFDQLQAKIECLDLLQRLRQAATPSSIGMPHQMAQRLHQSLQALDGSLAGLTYRQIAVEIFGAARVAADWHSSSRSLKDRTRRLVAKGHQLMKGGYLDLLH